MTDLHMPDKEQMSQPTPAQDDSPKFGRLLIVLVLAVMLIVLITFASESFYS